MNGGNGRPTNADGKALPWNSEYDPYWWKHKDLGSHHFIAPDHRIPLPKDYPPHMAKVEDTRCCLSPLVGQTVLARRVEDGYYYLGQVKQEISRNRFLVLFDQGKLKSRSTSLQEIWVYDIISYAEAFRHPIVPGDKVLAPSNNGKYRPATVIQGSERRDGDSLLGNNDILVSYLDNVPEHIGQNAAIWIPHNLFERLAVELRLPYDERQMELHHRPPLPGDVLRSNSGSVRNPGFDNCNCQPMSGEKPLQNNQEWPWWWKWWWNKSPPTDGTFNMEETCHSGHHHQRHSHVQEAPPCSCQEPAPHSCNPCNSLLRRSHSASNVRNTMDCACPSNGGYYNDDNFANFHAPIEVPVIDNDPLSLKVADQIVNHGHRLMQQYFGFEAEQSNPPVEEAATQTAGSAPLKVPMKKWKPPRRWMPTSKNEYGGNANVVMLDRIAQWKTYHEQARKANARPMSAQPVQRNCHCGYC